MGNIEIIEIKLSDGIIFRVGDRYINDHENVKCLAIQKEDNTYNIIFDSRCIVKAIKDPIYIKYRTCEQK